METTLTAKWDLDQDVDAPRRARLLTVDTLAEWGAEAMAEDAALLVSELVTNAVKHAGSSSRLELQLETTKLWIGVMDHGPGEAAIRPPASDGGWGLRFVQHTSSAWGTTRHPGASGKTVWCELVRHPGIQD